MTGAQKEKLQVVFDSLTEKQKNLDVLHLPYNEELKKVLNDKETITIEVSDAIRNRSIMTGYSGIINLLRVSRGEVILKPQLINELLYGRT